MPGTLERVRPGWRLIGFSVPHEKRAKYFGFVAPFPDKVVLGFEYGVLLDDPTGRLEGEGTQVRQVVLRPGARLPTSALGPLIEDAARVACLDRAVRQRLLAHRTQKHRK